MAQYGDLTLELQALPAGADWTQKGCRPSVSGLGKKPHPIDWSEMSQKFRQWALANAPAKYKGILDLIPDRQSALKHSRQSAKLSTLLADIRAWSPARLRNTEGEYKIELRKKLEELRYAINEEFGESNSDLVVEKAFVIETKKDPQLSDYDRLFGQAARHLQHFPVVIAVIFDVPSEDKFDNFKILVDVHLNKGKHTVEVVKK